MKKKILAGLLVAVLAITTIPFMGNNALYAQAEEITQQYILDSIMLNQDQREEMSVGDQVWTFSSVKNADGTELVYQEEWEYVSDDIFLELGLPLCVYSDDDTTGIDSYSQGIVFSYDGTIPQEAFGKYLHHIVGVYLIDDPENAAIDAIVSQYPVTSYCGTKHTTFMPNGSNATVFTIFNSDTSFKLTIPSSVEENGKSYKVTEIGEYALENDKGSKGLTSVTIPSTVKKIGKEAFKGAKNLKTITIKGNVTSIGKNAFSGINSKATFKIKATKTNYNKIVSRIKKSGVAKTVKFQRIK